MKNKVSLLLRNKKIYLLLILIVFLGTVLRTYGLDKSPPSVNWDEASLGYSAYSILKTGKDEYNQFLPIFTRSFDDYKSAIPAYLSIPLILLLGLNEVSIRLTSSIAGIISIIVIFWITNLVFRSYKVALLSSFFFSIAPYSVFFSRALFESNIALMFFLLGYLFYILQLKRLYLIILAAIFFILSMYTYHSYKVLVPLFVLCLFLTGKTYLNKKILLSTTAIGIILLIPMVIYTLTGETTLRFASTSILKLWPPPFSTALAEDHEVGQILNLLIHNHPFYFISEIFGRYIAYFSPLNIFVQEAREPGQRIPGMTALYPFEVIFWFIGLFAVFSRFRLFKSLVLLILLAPIPAVITWNWFHQVRVLPLLASFSILSGFGAYLLVKFVANYLKKSFRMVKLAYTEIIMVGFIVAFGIWNSFYLFDSLFVLLPKNYYGDWQPGFEESIPTVARLQDNYDRIIIETSHAQPYIFTLFYQAYPPDRYQKEADYIELAKGPRKKYDFGKYQFRKIYWPEDQNLKKTLFMGSVYSLPEQDIKNKPDAKIISDIPDRDGNISIRIVGLN